MLSNKPMFYLFNPNNDKGSTGPLSLIELESMLKSGAISKEHLAAKDGDADWRTLDEVLKDEVCLNRSNRMAGATAQAGGVSEERRSSVLKWAILATPVLIAAIIVLVGFHELKGSCRLSSDGWMAVMGNANAQNHLGVIYSNGQGVAQDDAEALKWFRKAAEQGHVKAQKNLGDMYVTGKGVAQSDAEAAQWYRKSAEQGFSDAQNNLGVMYYTGHGVAQDYAEAEKWLRKAAEQGSVDAQRALGISYFTGRGVPQDFSEADKWLRKAAEQGDADARRLLDAVLQK